MEEERQSGKQTTETAIVMMEEIGECLSASLVRGRNQGAEDRLWQPERRGRLANSLNY